MGDEDKAFIGDIDTSLETLRGWLHLETVIDQKEQEIVKVTVHVQNAAPPKDNGGEVVFIGVGLRISDGRGQIRSHPNWIKDIKKLRLADRQDLRQRYQKGVWVTGTEFPVTTSNEESFGEILFPTEQVDYEIQIPREHLPHIEIMVEGSVSRRYLFHFSQGLTGLERWTRPPLVETFRALNNIDITAPITHVIRAIPDFGAKTTLEELAEFRQTISEAMTQSKQMMQSLNKVFHTTTNQEIREHLKQKIGSYITSVEKIFSSTSDVLSSGDYKLMRETAELLKQQLPSAKEINMETLDMMSRFGIRPDEAGLGKKTS